MPKPREIAVQILSAAPGGQDYVENRLDQALAQYALAAPDRRLLQELVYGVIRWQSALDWLIERKTTSRPQKPALQILLRLGLYQMFWLDRVPGYAAVNETVELAKHLGFRSQAGFINAVLRALGREMAETQQALAALKSSQPEVAFSHPAWLYDRWRKLWGRDRAVKLLQWNNSPPPVFARLNRLRADPNQLCSAWKNEGVEFEAATFDWTGPGLVFALKQHPALAQLPSFQQGLFYLQDPSTLLAAQILGPLPGEAVLDACAAPGGKATYMAQLMRNQGTIGAEDDAEDRLNRVKENCQRLGITCVTTRPAPPPNQAPAPASLEKWDRILLDVPCSNTGVMRRRVELRWRLRPEEITRLSHGQLAILRRTAQRLKPGGVLVYSTCSLEPEENQDVVRAFLGHHRDFILDHERQLLPFNDGVDGAYVARLKLQTTSKSL